MRTHATDRDRRAHAFSHLARNLGVHRPLRCEQFWINAKQRGLQRGCVRDDATLKHGGCPGHIHDARSDQPSRKRFSDAKRPTELT